MSGAVTKRPPATADPIAALRLLIGPNGIRTETMFEGMRAGRAVLAAADAEETFELQPKEREAVLADALADLIVYLRHFDEGAANGDPPAAYRRAVEVAVGYGIIHADYLKELPTNGVTI